MLKKECEKIFSKIKKQKKAIWGFRIDGKIVNKRSQSQERQVFQEGHKKEVQRVLRVKRQFRITTAKLLKMETGTENQGKSFKRPPNSEGSFSLELVF